MDPTTLKNKGNTAFRTGDFLSAERSYTSAITTTPSNPILYTNRANARLKLHRYLDAASDCHIALALSSSNAKAHYFLSQAQLGLSQPDEALASSMKAYNLSRRAGDLARVKDFQSYSSLVLKCRKARLLARQTKKRKGRSALLAELEELLTQHHQTQINSITDPAEKKKVEGEFKEKVRSLRDVFESKRKNVPNWMTDPITFEIMHDPVTTKHGHSYERGTIIEHLKRNAVDPLTRETLFVRDLRDNLALREACEEFWNRGEGGVDW
ncbi:U-box-domain-containing protein [Piedraia hortae CBS 480.64]|uniref:U-box-domain-containing protein n=1 Tax=Piedraia hortae CBS 480.64 TaxID=1314780 RepID=A0A6A7BRN0_9PEZI|nr:U-box-domain-containing protein [Piedraia hortae CBS 480.64]